MAKFKIDEIILKKSPAGEAIIKANSIAKQWSSFSKHVEKCYVKSIDSSEFLLDPYRLKSVITRIASNSTILLGLGPEMLSAIKAWTLEECMRASNSFEAKIRAFCEKENITIDGRFPSYILQDFLQVNASQNDGTCKIGTKKIKSLLFESIVQELSIILNEEAKRPFENDVLLEQIYLAYLRAATIKKKNIGDPIPIKDLFFELVIVKQSKKFKKTPSKANYQEYSIEFFARDMAKLMKSAVNVTQTGKRLELTPTSFSKEGIPVLLKEGVRFVGRIAFTEGYTS